MQDLVSLILGVISGLMAYYIQIWIEGAKGPRITTKHLQAQFFAGILTLVAILLVFPNINGTGWLVALEKFLAMLLAAIGFYACIGAFLTLKDRINETGDNLPNNKTNQHKKKRTRRHK